MTSRELVNHTLEFRNLSGKAPMQLWTLPWAEFNYPKELHKINSSFEWDIVNPPVQYKTPPITSGDPFEIGNYIDEWGCIFTNIQRGVIGEAKEYLIPEADEEWHDISKIHIPTEMLTLDQDKINSFCKSTDKFVLSGFFPRPFEQLQFIRGTVSLYMDLVTKPKGMLDFLYKMHDFYCQMLTKWAETKVDGLMIMDDWGSQNSLLINPKTWVEIFKPLYKDYADIAKRYGKKLFMHSDGYILDILPHLIEIGIDAINSQIFCMGIDKLTPFKGKITFWGEMDRQNLLPYGSLDDINNAVELIYKNLWKDGGLIAQCEFGPGAKPENVYRMYEKWNEMSN